MTTYDESRSVMRGVVDKARGPAEGPEAAKYQKEVDKFQSERDQARKQAPKGQGGTQ